MIKSQPDSRLRLNGSIQLTDLRATSRALRSNAFFRRFVSPDIPEQMDHARRLRSLRRQMKQRGIDSLLVTHLPDVRYLCGFTGSNAYLAITAKRAAMFTDGRYTTQARQETSAAKVVIAAKSARDEACRWLASSGVEHSAFDPGSRSEGVV